MCRLADSPAVGTSHYSGAGPRFPVVWAKVT
jgi:hypothetical protein